MNKKVISILTLLCVGLLTGCVQNEDIATTSSIDIVVSDYFPLMGLERTYIQYGTTGENLIAKDVTKLETDSSGKESIYIHGTGGLVGETITEYEVNNDSIRVVYRINAFLNKEVDELELTNKKSWDVGISDDSVRYWTDKNLEISVPAGTFQNCIEITKVNKTKEDTSKTISYYAPSVGLIKTVFETDDEKHIFEELQSYLNAAEQIKEESEIKEQEKVSDDSSTVSPTPNFHSGNLPSGIDLISSLNINDYSGRVNEYAMNQVDYYLLHRPTFEEINNDIIYYFTDDITISCNKDGNIKEVVMKQDSSLTEEKLLYIQWLILGLDPDLTIEDANEIIFPKEDDQLFQVGEFNVGIMANSNSFIFKAVPY